MQALASLYGLATHGAAGRRADGGIGELQPGVVERGLCCGHHGLRCLVLRPVQVHVGVGSLGGGHSAGGLLPRRLGVMDARLSVLKTGFRIAYAAFGCVVSGLRYLVGGVGVVVLLSRDLLPRQQIRVAMIVGSGLDQVRVRLIEHRLGAHDARLRLQHAGLRGHDARVRLCDGGLRLRRAGDGVLRRQRDSLLRRGRLPLSHVQRRLRLLHLYLEVVRV